NTHFQGDRVVFLVSKLVYGNKNTARQCHDHQKHLLFRLQLFPVIYRFPDFRHGYWPSVFLAKTMTDAFSSAWSSGLGNMETAFTRGPSNCFSSSVTVP